MNAMHATPIALAAGLLLAGCQQHGNSTASMGWDDNARKETNAWLVRTYNGQQVENAVTRQHTIWSHHFIEGTTALTPRAVRDLGILRDHYARHNGGVLTVRRGEADETLYEERIAVLNGWFTEEGISMDTVDVQHDLYTGDGKRSTRAAQDYVRPSSEEPFSFHSSSDK